MKQNINKFSIIVFCIFLLTCFSASAESPEEKGLRLAIEGDKRDEGFQDTTSQMKMKLRNAQGEESIREFYSKTLEVLEDGDKSIFIFEYPRDVSGTAVLTFTHKQGPDDQWLYLPALKRVKRISSDNKTGSFVGSEFAYEDLSSQEIEKYTYKWIQDIPCPGKEEITCFNSEDYPIDKSSGYTKRVIWTDYDEFRVWKIEFYDRKESLLKTLVFSDYKLYLDKYWRSHFLHMVNHNTAKETEIIIESIKFQSGLKDSDFNRQALKRVR